MNEQIKKLVQEAGFVLWGDEEWNHGDVIDWASNYDQEIVKYTELVVRQCTKIAIDNGCGDFVDIKQKLFEHFVVEE